MRKDISLTLEQSTKEGVKVYAKRHHTSVSQIAERFFAYLVESDSTPENRFIHGGRIYHY